MEGRTTVRRGRVRSATDGRSTWIVPVACLLLAGAAAAAVAVVLAPTGDEFHTLAYARRPDPGSAWEAYRSARDTLPPAWYGSAWLAARLPGADLVDIRAASVVSWALAAGVLAATLRRFGACAQVAGALLPTASTMLLLGAWGRPYAVSFLAVTVVLWGWVRSRRAPVDRTTLAALALASFVAVLFHYVALAAVAAVAVAELLVPRTGRGRRAVLCALAAGMVPLAMSLPLLPAAIDDQARIPANAGPAQAVVFHLSAFRPIVGPVLGLLLLAAGAVALRRRPVRGGSIGRRSSWQPEEVVGACVLVLVPALAVLGMSLTSGVYWHRYAAPAVAGAGLLVGSLLGRLRTVRWAPPATAAVVVVAAVAAPIVTVQEHVNRSDVERLGAQVRQLAGPHGRVAVADPSTFELLAHVRPDLEPRLVLLDPSPYAGREDALDRTALDGAPDVVLVGRSEIVEDQLRRSDRRCAESPHAEHVVVARAPRTVLACRTTTAD